MKKALSLLMVFCLLAALLPAMSAAAATNPVAVITVSGIDHPQPDGEQDLTPEITLDHPDALESVQITWFDMADENDFVGTQMAEGETFTLGHHVYARIRVTLKPGCDFAKSDSSYYTGTVNFDGLLPGSIRVETDSENRAYLNLLSKNYYVRDDAKVTAIRVEGLDPGEVGGQPDRTIQIVTAPENAVREASVDWYHWDQKVTAVGSDETMADGMYKATLHIYFNDGFYAADPDFAYDGNLTVPGFEVDWAHGAGGSQAAMWIELMPQLVGTYKIHYDAGRGSGTMDDVVLHDAAEAIASTPSFTPPEGAAFDHWGYQKANGKIGALIPGEQIPLNDLTGAEITLTAIYSDKVVTTLKVTDPKQPVAGGTPAELGAVEALPDGIDTVTSTVQIDGAPVTGKFEVGKSYSYTLNITLKKGYAPMRELTPEGMVYTGQVEWDGFAVTPEKKVSCDAEGRWSVTLSGTSKCRFVDVSPEDWFAESVDWAVDTGVTVGTSATHFSPNMTCTRAQVVTFLWRANHCPEPSGTANPFVDVTADRYYAKAVLWAVENGITQGVDKTHFGPNETCTRAQVVTFLWRANRKPDPKPETENSFQDVSAEQYYYKAVLWAVENGITVGTTKTTFSPKEHCTRAQIVTFLYRALA